MNSKAVIPALLLLSLYGFARPILAQDEAAPDATKVLADLMKANAEKDVTSISVLLKSIVETLAGGDAPCVTLAALLHDPDKLQDANVVKVVRDRRGRALYFSRSPIPHSRGAEPSSPRLRHIGVYGFDRATLLSVPDLPSGGLDRSEGLEQLRFLENGISITVLDAQGDPWGIEAREDYDAFLRRESARANSSSSSKKAPS